MVATASVVWIGGGACSARASSPRPAPFPPPLRDRCLGVVQSLPRYYQAVRLPASVHHRRMSLDFPMRSAPPSAADSRGISRFPCKALPYMLGVSDRAGSRGVSRSRRPRYGLPPSGTASAPPTGRSSAATVVISRLNTRPARSPINASPRLYGRRRMTRGRCGSLALHRMTLSFTTPHRFIQCLTAN